MITRQVTHSEGGKRLHRYIRTLLPHRPLGELYKMIDQGLIRVNGKRKNQNYVLQAHDEITLQMDTDTFDQGKRPAQPPKKYGGIDANIAVLYEDDGLLVVNKPTGVLTHPAQKAEYQQSLISRVHAYLHHQGKLDSTLFLPATANRLDRNTSGIVLIGKTAQQLHALNVALQQRTLEKTYVTVVQGKLRGSGDIRMPLLRDHATQRTKAVYAEAHTEKSAPATPPLREAWTSYAVIGTHDDVTLVQIQLHSGRTHQIRAHFQQIGHPLVGDTKYGGMRMPGNGQYFLHAWRVVMPDGRTFEAPLPFAFRKAMTQWRWTSFVGMGTDPLGIT